MTSSFDSRGIVHGDEHTLDPGLPPAHQAPIVDEDDEFEEPDGDEEREEFLESVVDRLGEMVRFCHEMIDEGDGEPIDG